MQVQRCDASPVGLLRQSSPCATCADSQATCASRPTVRAADRVAGKVHAVEFSSRGDEVNSPPTGDASQLAISAHKKEQPVHCDSRVLQLDTYNRGRVWAEAGRCELVATEPCRSERKGEDVTLKFSMVSSGCETRAVKAEPSRLVVSLAVRRVIGGLMRRYTSVRAMGFSQRKDHPGMPRVSTRLKAAVAQPETGRGGATTGAVLVHGTYEEDTPVTRETQAYPPEEPVAPESRDNPKSPADVRKQGHARTGEEQAPVGSGSPKARGTGALDDVCLGVGGLRSSDEVGEGVATDPVERRRPVSSRNRVREP